MQPLVNILVWQLLNQMLNHVVCIRKNCDIIIHINVTTVRYGKKVVLNRPSNINQQTKINRQTKLEPCTYQNNDSKRLSQEFLVLYKRDWLSHRTSLLVDRRNFEGVDILCTVWEPGWISSRRPWTAAKEILDDDLFAFPLFLAGVDINPEFHFQVLSMPDLQIVLPPHSRSSSLSSRGPASLVWWSRNTSNPYS